MAKKFEVNYFSYFTFIWLTGKVDPCVYKYIQTRLTLSAQVSVSMKTRLHHIQLSQFHVVSAPLDNFVQPRSINTLCIGLYCKALVTYS